MRVWLRLCLAHAHTNKEYLLSTYHVHKCVTSFSPHCNSRQCLHLNLAMTEMQLKKQVFAQGHGVSVGEPGLLGAV